MRQVFLTDVGNLELREVPVPEPESGEVLIRVIRASVCNGSDGALYSGRREIPVAYPWMELPHPVGHECAGEVVAVGPDVSNVDVGQRVASLRYGAAYSDYQINRPARDRLFTLPDRLSWDEGTFIEPLYAASIYMPYLEEDDNVVLFGLGPSGMMFLELCLELPVKGLICVDRHDLRLEIAGRMGAGIVVNTDREDLDAVVQEHFGEADAFIDASGRDVYDIGIRLLAPDGKFVAYGVPDGEVRFDGTLAFFKGTRFLGRPYNFCDPSVREPTFARMRRQIDSGSIDFTSHVTHHFPLERTEEAIQLAVHEPDKCLCIVIDVA